MAKYNFCTLFDSNYILQGLVMYQSLRQCCSDFHLFVFAFDSDTEKILRSEKLECMTVIGLSEFENDRLLAVKSSRTKGEYCWTCSSSSILHVLSNYEVQSCTYIDADLYFWSDPSILIDGMKNSSVLIVAHRYSKKFKYLEVESGRYCVQFVTIKNDENGLRVLNWWVDKCIEWCYNRIEDGKFGDQKYLDYWPILFPGVQECIHEGAGLAPWNISDYKILKDGVINDHTNQFWNVIFYHFHGTKFCRNKYVFLAGSSYFLSNAVISRFYKYYIKSAVQIYQSTLKKYEFMPDMFFQNKPIYDYTNSLKYSLKQFCGSFYTTILYFCKLSKVFLFFDKLRHDRFIKFR